MATSSPTCERFEKLLHDVRCSPCVLLVHEGKPLVGAEIDEMRRLWGCRLHAVGAGPGEPMGMEAPFTPDAVALLLAMLAKGCIAALVPAGDRANDAALRSLRAVHGWRQAPGGPWTLEERLPPFEGERPKLPRAPGLLLAGERRGSFETALAIDDLLRSTEAAGASKPPLGPLHTRHGVTALFHALVRGVTLVIPPTPAPHGPVTTPARR